ncbi:MAG: ABC transporter permease [Planctomycetes bacterium]|nr:ABC transporter permease [Planctomycetota bacterium]
MNLSYIKSNFQTLLARKDLVRVLVHKRLREKHVGSILGYFWTFYSAAFPLVSYVLVFFFIAKIKIEGVDSVWQYMLFVFTGLLPWLFFSRSVSEGVDTINSSLDLLKQAIFPVEVLSIVSVTETFLAFLFQCVVLLVIAILTSGINPVNLALLPFFLAALYAFCLGLAWILSIIGFFLRDLKEILTSFISFMIYFTPVVYAKENFPEKLWFVFMINPMTHAIGLFRGIFSPERFSDYQSLAVFMPLSLIVFVIGYISILNVKQTIGDMV